MESWHISQVPGTGQGLHGTRQGSPASKNKVKSEKQKILTQLLNNPEID